MELIKTFREKQQTSKQNNITQQAHDLICLDDFDNKLYIAFHGTPLVPIDENLSQKEILTKLEEVRRSYINHEMRQLSMSKVAMFL